MFLFLLILVSTTSVFAAGGFEKPALWSAKAVSLGGAVGSLKGADSLYFNPAGMDGTELNLHYAALHGYLNANVTDQNNETTTRDIINSGGILGSYKLNKVTFGAGVYGLAGLNTDYKSVDFAKVDSSLGNYNQDVYGKLSVVEFAIGSSIELSSNLRFGASVRGQQAQAKFKDTSIIRSQGLGGLGVADGTVLAATTAQFDDLKGSSFGSYKLGLQYQSDDKRSGLGLSYRSPVKIKVKGDLKGKIAYTNTGAAATNFAAGANIVSAGQQYDQTSSGGSIESSIPQQVVFDGNHLLSDKVMVVAGISWTQYSMNKKLGIDGDLTNTADGQTAALADVQERKHDMYDLKTGLQFEYDQNKFLRAGFTHTNAVTNKNYTSATSAPPSSYQHYALGWGSSLSSKWFLDLALEYYRSSGSGKTPQSETGANSYVASVSSKYSTEVYAGFFSLNRSF